MKHLKMLGLAAVAVTAFAAFLGGGSASATVLCKTAANPCPTESRFSAGAQIDGSLMAGTSLTWENAIQPVDTCTGSTFKVKSTTPGSSTETVMFAVEEWTFSGCLSMDRLITPGEMQVHWVSGTNNGTLTARGTSGTAAGCSWSLPEWTTIGLVKGGNPASIEIDMPDPFICLWRQMTASYTVSTPKPLYVEGS